MNHFLTYFSIVLYSILLDASPLFRTFPREISLLTFLFLILFFFRSYFYLHKQFLVYLSLYVIATLYHLLINPNTLFSDFNIMLSVFCGYVLIKEFRDNYFLYFIKSIYALSVLSLITWISHIFLSLIFGPDRVFDFLSNFGFLYRDSSNDMFLKFDRLSIGIANYTNQEGLWYRNFGMFWEPGILSHFVGLGLIFYELMTAKGFDLSNKYRNTMVVAILSSFSTAGYVFIFFYLLYFLLRYINNLNLDISIIANLRFIFIIISCLSFAMFFSLDFIGAKIMSQFSTDVTSYMYYNGRLNILFELSRIRENFLLGSGSYSPAILSNEFFNYANFKTFNGIVILLKSWGIIIFTLTIYHLNQSIELFFGERNFQSLLILILFLLLGFAQNVFIFISSFTIILYKFAR